MMYWHNQQYLRSNESVNGGHIRGSALRFLTSIAALFHDTKVPIIFTSILPRPR